MHPDLPPDAALAKLWEQIVHVCRLDEDDPVAAWRERMATLAGVTERLTAARFDAIHFEGPGTDLTVGLLPSSQWLSASFATADGIAARPQPPLRGGLHDARPRARRRRRARDQAAARSRARRSRA